MINRSPVGEVPEDDVAALPLRDIACASWVNPGRELYPVSLEEDDLVRAATVVYVGVCLGLVPPLQRVRLRVRPDVVVHQFLKIDARSAQRANHHVHAGALIFGRDAATEVFQGETDISSS
jgi:hypothetical protein